MTDYPVFKNPPIVETLLDIAVTLPPETHLATLMGVQSRVRERYPNRQERQHWEIQAATTTNDIPEVSQSVGIVGYLFSPPAPHQDRAFQARVNGFTFSKLRPYQSWKPFRNEAKELWDIYTEVANPANVRRLGLRTINSLDLPLPFDDFKEYILTTPEVAPNIPAGLSQFFMQLVIPQSGGETAVITSALQPQQPNSATVTVILDIDIYVEQDFLPASDAIWERFESLRRIRNDIFFNSLTEKAKELF